MDKKKIAIIALVFIFLGTMIFAFANPKDEDFKGNSVPSKVDEDKTTDDEKKDEETLGEEEENNNTNFVTNTNGDNNADEVVNVVDYYKLALEAVEKAEASLFQNDVDSAKDLINNVTTDQKEDLLDRINDVQNIIDFDKLLKVLENKTNSSTNKDELNDARDFNTSNSIADKLNSLKDSASKTGFEERYNVVMLTLNDVTNPVINGITEGEYTNREVEIEVVDDSEYTITLDDKAYELGTSIEEGKHVIKVVDKAFNETVVNFTIDRTAPSMIVGDTTYGPDHEGIIYSSTRFTATASDLNGVKEIYANGHLRDKIDVNGEGKYTFRLVDMAGNESTFTVIVDKTLPAVTLKKWMSDNNHIEVTPGNHNYYVLAEYSDANLESAKLDGNDYESGALITGEGEHTLIVRDMAGNETPITFTIDRTYPVVKINGESFDHDNQDIKYYKNVEVEIIEENIDSITLTKDGNTVEYNNEYVFEEGKYALTVRDTAKNKTVVNFVVDHTAPSMIVGNTTYGPDHEGIIYSSTRFKATASDLNGVKEIYTNGHLRDKIDVSGKGKYIFRLVDMAGNENIFTVILVDLVIDSNEDLVYAIKNQADNQKWIIKSGNYTLNRNFEDEYGAPTSSQTGWFFPITANNLTITGEGTVSITAGEDAENGVWSSQNFVTIFGDGVTIDNITFVPHVDPVDRTTNKSIEIIGNNVVLKDINIEPKYETSSGSIYVGSKGIITTLENVNLNKGRISLTGADSTNVLNLINVTADFAGALNEDYLGYWNPNGAKVNIENFKVTVSDALSSDDLNDLVANVPAGTIIFMKNGEYNLGHLEINNSIILTGESKENTIINVDSDSKSGGQAVLGRQLIKATPWLTERHG